MDEVAMKLPNLLRHATPLLLSLLVAGNLAAQAPRWTVVCENFHGGKAHFIDNMMAASGDNRKTITAPDAINAKVRIWVDASGQSATLEIPAEFRSARAPANIRARRQDANEFATYTGFDPDDGTLYVVSYFQRVNRMLWTAHSDRLLGRDKAAHARTYIGECARAEMR
jgi:hypothetical protein